MDAAPGSGCCSAGDGPNRAWRRASRAGLAPRRNVIRNPWCSSSALRRPREAAHRGRSRRAWPRSRRPAASRAGQTALSPRPPADAAPAEVASWSMISSVGFSMSSQKGWPASMSCVISDGDGSQTTSPEMINPAPHGSRLRGYEVRRAPAGPGSVAWPSPSGPLVRHERGLPLLPPSRRARRGTSRREPW